jgi:hypothetical protein
MVVYFNFTPYTKTLYFLKEYGQYEQFSKEDIPFDLAESLLAEGVAVEGNIELEEITMNIISGEFQFITTSSAGELKRLLTGIRVMLAEIDEEGVEDDLFKFFYTDHEPWGKEVQNFISHPYFMREEVDFLKEFVRENFIDRVTLRHQINALQERMPSKPLDKRRVL